MIVLLDKIDKETQFFMKSVSADNSNVIFVLMSESYKPETECVSIQECIAKCFEIDSESYGRRAETHLFQISIPSGYNVRYHDSSCAVIYNKDVIKGYAYFCDNVLRRYIHRVEWLDLNMKVNRVDYYYRHRGIAYSEDVSGQSEERKVLSRIWFDNNGDVKIRYDAVTGYYSIFDNGCTVEICNDFERLKRALISQINHTECVLTSADQIKMYAEINGNDFSGVQCIVYDKNELERIRDYCRDMSLDINIKVCLNEQMGGLLLLENEQGAKYSVVKRDASQRRKAALVLTSTEDIVEIERFCEDFADLKIFVAAHTDVSPRLKNLTMFSNVEVIQFISEDRVDEIMKEVDFYMDIHRGFEIYDGSIKAYFSNVLLLGYQDTIKHCSYMNDELIAYKDDYQTIKRILRRCIDDNNFYWEELNKQSQ